MKKIIKKNGASMVLALFTFLIVTMVSMVIVSAALTNLARVRERQENEQAYLAMSTLADYLSEQILATAVNGTTQTRRYVHMVASLDGDGNVTDVTTSSGGGFANTPYEPVLNGVVEEAKRKKEGLTPTTKSYMLDIEGTRIGGENSLSEMLKADNIKVRVTTGENPSDPYEILMVMTMKNPAYTMSLKFNSAGGETNSGTDEHGNYLADVYWTEVTIEK